jgi:hypothetical protein
MRNDRGRGSVRLIAAVTFALLALPAGADAARLVGGDAWTAISRAFDRVGGHRGQVIISIRASTVNPSWSVVKSARVPTPGSSVPTPAIVLQRTYFQALHERPLAGLPPAAVMADLDSDFRIEIVYAGSGTETFRYQASNGSQCGPGSYTDLEQGSVSPMSWRVGYVVDLDRILAILRSSEGDTIVPAVTFALQGSELSAVQRVSRSSLDTGCGDHARSYVCTTTYHLPSSSQAQPVWFAPGGVTGIPVPFSRSSSGECAAGDYASGPSLWDGGAATAVVAGLSVVARRPPADPYARIAVSWPAASPPARYGFLPNACGTPIDDCVDQLSWSATVSLIPYPQS